MDFWGMLSKPIENSLKRSEMERMIERAWDRIGKAKGNVGHESSKLEREIQSLTKFIDSHIKWKKGIIKKLEIDFTSNLSEWKSSIRKIETENLKIPKTSLKTFENAVEPLLGMKNFTNDLLALESKTRSFWDLGPLGNFSNCDAEYEKAKEFREQSKLFAAEADELCAKIAQEIEKIEFVEKFLYQEKRIMEAFVDNIYQMANAVKTVIKDKDSSKVKISKNYIYMIEKLTDLLNSEMMNKNGLSSEYKEKIEKIDDLNKKLTAPEYFSPKSDFLPIFDPRVYSGGMK